MVKKTILSAAFVPLVFCLVFSCGKEVKKGSIKVGIILPLTGELSTYGKECLNGIVLRFDELDQESGVRDKKVSYVTEDNQGDPLKTANAVDLLAKDEQILAIIGAATSENTLAGASVAQAKRIPLLTPLATSPVVTEVGDYISRICFIDPDQGSALANFAFSFLKLKKIAILTKEDDPYSEGLTEYFIKNYRQMGGEIISHLYYKEGERDFVSRLKEIKEKEPEAIFVPGYWSEAASIFKQAKKLGLELFFLGGDGWESPNFFQEVEDVLEQKDNIYITSHFSADNVDPQSKKFVESYQKRYGETPAAPSALGYDAAGVMIDALKRTPQLTRVALKDAINVTSNFPGVTGTITLNEKRNAVKPVVILKSFKGKFIYFATSNVF